MRRSFVALTASCALSLTAASPSHAQANAAAKRASNTSAFAVGYTDIGPTLGLGGLGSAGLSFGGRFERGVKALPDLGNGVLGFQVSVDYYSYNNRFVGTDFGFSFIPIGATANYHFALASKKVDPFIGAGLGFLVASTSYDGSDDGSYNSGLYFIGRAGVRYFWKPNMASYADLGAGAATLNVGLMFGVGGNK